MEWISFTWWLEEGPSQTRLDSGQSPPNNCIIIEMVHVAGILLLVGYISVPMTENGLR